MQSMNTGKSDTTDMYILAGDIGGTNTSLALIRDNKGNFHIESRKIFSTQKLSNLQEAIREAISGFTTELGPIEIKAASLSIAGPVENNRCVPTNISWTLDGGEIEKEFGFRTLVINDFTAICYGVPLLDRNNPGELTPLPHPDGSIPGGSSYLPGIGVQAVLGAGTGLGVGFLIEERDRILALPAEGGHVDFGPFSPLTLELRNYMERKNGDSPEPEMFISGLGIANIYHFMVDEKGADSDIIRSIADLDDLEKPPAISANVEKDDACRTIMTLFVEMYARAAHNLSLCYIPKNGLFLAGGIAAKNKKYFLEDNRFMKTFLHNFQSSIRPVLKSIPVYIVEDYKISLYGAAHAFVQLSKFLD